MDIGDNLAGLGILLVLVAVALISVEPAEIVVDPDPRFNIEAQSFVNGSAQFQYTPVTNETADYTVSYRTFVDGEVTGTVVNKTMENISRTNPVKVNVEARPEETVSVEMKIWTTEGQLVHQSRNVIGPA